MALAGSVRMEIAGQKVPDFLDVSINQQMHGLSDFTVSCRLDTFEDPDDFVINKSKKWIGSTMVIEIGGIAVGGKSSVPGLFFKGVIFSVKAVKSDLTNEDKIILSGFSPEVLLNDHKSCRAFENKNLGQIVSEVLKPFPRDVLNAKVSPYTTDQIPYCVQYRENNLEFLQRLAARYGEWLYYNGKELIFGSSQTKTETLTLGLDLESLDFDISLGATGVTYVSYDYSNAKSIKVSSDSTTGRSQQNEVGKYAFDQSWKKFNHDVTLYYPHLNIVPASYGKVQKASMEADACSVAVGMSGIKARGENLNLVPGVKIKVGALKKGSSGQVDYGEYIISSIHHSCDNLRNYSNHFTAFPVDAKVPVYTNTEAFPLCEPQSAVVKDNKDPEKLGRVKVSFFWHDGNVTSPWIRAVNPYSANERGFYFIPEIGDEVMVGFEGGDAEKPFVIGSMYHGKNKPPSNWPNQNNSFKGIVTQSKLRIEFDDAKKITTIDTPGGNKVVISDDQKSILLSDQNRNTVELKPDGIVMDSPKDIKITSKAKITLDSLSGVEITSKADVKVSGMNIQHTADIGFTAKGNATAEISASGQTTVKGAFVMIN